MMMDINDPLTRNILSQQHTTISCTYMIFIRQILQTVYSTTGGCKSEEIAYNCEPTWFQIIYRDTLLPKEIHKVVS
jgi:hypothetical protein